jgi:RimJ/RimL family protein N-acetyltransferase
MPIDGPILQTSRLVLRPPREEDLDRWAEFSANPDSMRFMGGVAKRGASWRALAAVAGSWALRGYGMFSIIERESGLWVGRGGPHQPEGWPGTEVGWGLHPDATGKGYATEAASAAMDFAVDVLGWTDIIHLIAPANMNSQKVAERLGSVRRGPGALPDPFENETVDLWGQSADEWRRLRNSV